MSEMLHTDGIYVGEEFVKKGEKDGVQWSMWKRSFKPSMDSQKKFGFTWFKKEKVADIVLDPGESYIIDYYESEYQHPQYGMQKSKKAVSFTKGKLTPEQKAASIKQQPQKSPAPAKPATLDMSKFDEFVQLYKEFESPAKSEIHMVGMYLLTYFNADYKALYDKCKATKTTWEKK